MGDYGIGVPLTDHHIYIKDTDLERWVETLIANKIFADWSHAVSQALAQLKQRMPPPVQPYEPPQRPDTKFGLYTKKRR
ncbi:hypothetical protein ES703_00029 [subsurface metagenome]